MDFRPHMGRRGRRRNARNRGRGIALTWLLVTVVSLAGAVGCVTTTVEEQPQFRKFEPAPPRIAAAPRKPVEQPEPVAAPQPTPPPQITEPRTPPPAKPEPAGPVEARVAILLPLSGFSATLGRAMLDAAQLSMFEIADKAFVLMPFDTGGTEEGARRAAAAAVAARAHLILGPLHAASVRAVAPLARAANVPVIAFSNSREVAGDGVYILGFVPRQQVEAVIGYAASEGLFRFAVLAPDDDYGQAVMQAARGAIEAGGGFLIRAMYYDPAATDLTDTVKAFANYDARRGELIAQRKALKEKDDEVSRRALRRLERLETIGDAPFDAVLVPESGERLRALSSLLSYFDIDRPAVRLLGLRSWDLIANLGSEPALIGAWYAGSPVAERERFAVRFKKAFGRLPPRLATLAYDAAALAAILGQGGPDYSPAALADSSGFLGIDGIFRLRADGIAERAFAIHEVTRDGTIARRPAPRSFTPLTN
jgi:ABC-type branched-subunit amino acid transport system substrate-binding protein